ncbi:hypothetical protein GCK32_007300, partial [Trichostrongylus colubriformis]
SFDMVRCQADEVGCHRKRRVIVVTNSPALRYLFWRSSFELMTLIKRRLRLSDTPL